MLFELLRLIESASGPVTLSDLQRTLVVDAATLDGMIQFWVRKGRLHVNGRSEAVCGSECATAGCSCGSCSGAEGCPFIARLPIAYELTREP
jgi:hypothetical protein